MKPETPEEKWKRLQGEIQQGILDGYPNPERRGCLDRDCIHALAARSAQFDDTIEEGDVLLTSDPYACGAAISHANDWLLVLPIFH